MLRVKLSRRHRLAFFTILLVGIAGMDHLRADEPKKPEPPPTKVESSQGPTTVRGKRVQRWTVNYNTKDSKDYLSQLDACGAFLGIPDLEGKVMVIRDLKERPARPKHEDVKALNRIYFVDDNGESAKRVGTELGLDVIPSVIVAFHSREFEQVLLKKELEAAAKLGAKDEADIKRTTFKVTMKDGKPEVTVEKVELAKP